MPSRNLFILAAAMQLPLALWLHGCKDDDDDKKTGDKEVDTTETPDQPETTTPETDPSEKMHSKVFLTNQHKEIVADMLKKEGDWVKFFVRKSLFGADTERSTATALAAYMNESTEGMVSLHGPAFSYTQLLSEWKADFVPDMWDSSNVYEQITPGTLSTPALQNYMIGKNFPVVHSSVYFNTGANTAQTKITDAIGEVDFSAVQNMQQMQTIQRNLIVTELYHNGYKNVPHNPKKNPYNFAVTFFQVNTDLDIFWDICTRAFHQVLTVNQMLAMEVSSDAQAKWDTDDHFEKAKDIERYADLTAWELFEKKTTEAADTTWILKPMFGSRNPGKDSSRRNIKYFHSLQQQIESNRQTVVQELKMLWSNTEFSQKFSDKIKGQESWANKHFVSAFMSFALHQLNTVTKFGGLEQAKLVKALQAIAADVDELYAEVEVQKDDLYKKSKKVQWMKKIAEWKFIEFDGKINDEAEMDVVVVGVKNIELPEFMFELLISDKRLTPAKAGVVAFEEFQRELRKDGFPYLIPCRKELMALRDYKIEVLEVVHPGPKLSEEFAQVMMVAFYQAFRNVKNSQYGLQLPSNSQIILGDASAIHGHNGFQYNQQMQQPITRPTKWHNSMMIEQVHFVTIQEQTEGDKAVKCFKTHAEELHTVDVEVTIKEHREVQQVKPAKKGKDSKQIHNQIRAMQ